MYHPGTGRFLSEDPLGFEAGDSNLYRYVQNSPPNYTDPMGQRGVPVVVPEVPPGPFPVAPAQPTPSPRIPGLGVLGGAAIILLQDLLFPRPAGFGEDEFLEQLRQQQQEIDEDREICTILYEQCVTRRRGRVNCALCQQICIQNHGEWPFDMCPIPSRRRRSPRQQECD